MINACGLVGSKRNKSDGCTIIGSQEKGVNGVNEEVNDFVISNMDTGIGKRHMVIKYNLDNRSYYLRDLGDGSGTFVRLDVPLILRHGYIISFGDSHMVV
jgi:FHA domain